MKSLRTRCRSGLRRWGHPAQQALARSALHNLYAISNALAGLLSRQGAPQGPLQVCTQAL
eukprot:2343829-Pleurochrysis_carterae.AAC.5